MYMCQPVHNWALEVHTQSSIAQGSHDGYRDTRNDSIMCNKKDYILYT